MGNIAVEDRSYNIRLKRDGKRKIIFIYFYAAIIYYLVRLLKDYGYTKPEKVLFRRTGSKLLNIIGGKETLEDLTTQFITKFSANQFTYSDDISIEIERKEPKQLTAKGALHKKKEFRKNRPKLHKQPYGRQQHNTLFHAKKREMNQKC